MFESLFDPTGYKRFRREYDGEEALITPDTWENFETSRNRFLTHHSVFSWTSGCLSSDSPSFNALLLFLLKGGCIRRMVVSPFEIISRRGLHQEVTHQL